MTKAPDSISRPFTAGALIVAMLLASTLRAEPGEAAAAEVTGAFVMASDKPVAPPPRVLSPAVQRGLELLDEDDRTASERLVEMRALVLQEQNDGTLMAAYGELLSKSGDDEAAMIAFEKSTALDPALHTPWMWIGIIAKRGNPRPDLPRAEAAFRKALELGAPRARGLNELAVTVAMAGRMREARDLWVEAVREDPNWGVLYGNLVKAALSLGDERLAMAQVDPALAAERFNESVILQLGTHLERGKRWSDAESLYRRALDKHPHNVPYHLALGRVLVELKRPDAAIECFQTAKRLGRRQGLTTIAQQADWEIFRLEHPSDERVFQTCRELVFSQQGDRRTLERNYRRAIDRLNPLIQRHPDFWNARFVRGVAYRRLDQRDRARADLLAVLKINPDEANATMELALMERDEFDFAEAARLAERAVELAPRDPIFAMNAAFILIEADQCERAWELYRQALRMVGEENTTPLLDQLQLRCPREDRLP